MDPQQMMELLLKEMKVMQEKGEADRKAALEDLLAKMDADRKADQEMAEADRKIDKEERKADRV
jgi:hypothetical protein